MAVIKSGASSDQLTIDSTSKAARVTLYDPDGNVLSKKVATYAAALGNTNTAAGTGVFLSILGSSTKTIRVHKVVICGTVATAAVYGSVVCNKRLTGATTGGTATTITPQPHDSTSGAASAVVKYYTALATAGTGGGMVAAQSDFFPITATVTSEPANLLFLPQQDTGAETQDWVLRGTNECLEFAFSATTTNAPTLTVWVIFTEE
jgi:hypothetical protein